MDGRSKGQIGAMACVVAVSPELSGRHSSSLVLFLHMTFLAMGARILWAHTLLASLMQVRYWELPFGNAVKAARTRLVEHGTRIAIPGVVVERKKEAKPTR